MGKKPTTPSGLFSTTLDEIATAWHKNPGAPDEAKRLMQQLLALESLVVAEGLLLAPKLSFKVYGENVVLCRLIDAFGEAGVQRLLEEDAIEFVLWRPLIAHWDKPLEGVFPIVAGKQTSAPHCDPEVSAKLGLEGWSKEPVKDIKGLVRLAAERTRVPEESLPHSAVAVLRSAIEAGVFHEDGLDPTTPWHEIPKPKLHALTQLAEDMVEAAVVLKAGLDFREPQKSWESLLKTTAAFRSSGGLHETAEAILRLEALPNIPELILKRAVSFQDIVEIRNSEATKEFREWLWANPDPSDAKAVGEQYLAAMKPNIDLADKGWFKTARITTLTAITTAGGAALGGAVAGTPGVIAGGALSLAGSLIDAFGLERLFKSKRNPRRFADEEIRPRASSLLDDLKAEAARAKAAGATGSAPVEPRPSSRTQQAPAKATGNRHQRRAKAAEEKRKAKSARKRKAAQRARKRKKRK